MFTRFTFRKINFVASRLGPWISKAFNRKTKVKNLIALPIALLTAVLVITTFAVSARGWLAKTASTKTAGGENQTQTNHTAVRIEAQPITLTPQGFEPTEITRPKGPFLLVINDRTGPRPLEWRLERQGGNHLKSVSMPMGKHKWREVVDLPPGNYLLSESGNPQWKCQITITDQ